MALKRLSTVVENAPVSKKDEMPVIKISGRSVTRFNEATAELKKQEAIQKEERAKLLQKGLAELFAYNIANPTSPATSIQLMQDNEVAEGEQPIAGDGEVVRLTFQDRYSACDADTADTLFEDLLRPANADRPAKKKLSINDFMQETVTAGFNSKVFNTGDKGEFNQKVFDAYAAAIEKVTAELIAKKVLPEGTKSPLAVTKKVLPLANFHGDRWTQFPSVVAQEQLFEVVSNTVTLTPVVAK
jgi:hypothetical protein